MSSSDPILALLPERDRLAFQSRRYANWNLWIMRLPSGRLILSDGKRDPIALIHNWEQLRDELLRFQDVAARRQLHVDHALRRLRDGIKSKEEEDEFADIKIEL